MSARHPDYTLEHDEDFDWKSKLKKKTRRLRRKARRLATKGAIPIPDRVKDQIKSELKKVPVTLQPRLRNRLIKRAKRFFRKTAPVIKTAAGLAPSPVEKNLQNKGRRAVQRAARQIRKRWNPGAEPWNR